MKNIVQVHYPRVSPGDHSLTKKPDDSGFERFAFNGIKRILAIRELKQRQRVRRRQRERLKWAYLVGKNNSSLHALHVRFSLLSISLPSSAKGQSEISKFEVL